MYTVEIDWTRKNENRNEFYQKLLKKAVYQNNKHKAKRNEEEDFKIVGGHDVTNHTWPFLVNIGNKCGGSIIGKLNLNFENTVFLTLVNSSITYL